MYGFDFSTFSADEIILYLRKSRSDNPDMTIEEVLKKHYERLQDWSKRTFGEQIPEENILREVVSGETISARPKMSVLLNTVEKTNIKAVLVNDIQRLSRGDLEDCGRIIKIFRYTNTYVFTPEFCFDLNITYDRDNFEREIKRGSDYLEYQKKIMFNGRMESVKKGNYIGSTPPYGYDRVCLKDGKEKFFTLQENKQEADIVRLIFKLYNEGMGYAKIARYLNDLQLSTRKGKLWNSSTLKGIIESVHYIGKVSWNKRRTVNIVENGDVIKIRPVNSNIIVANGKHDAIIDEEVFMKAQSRLGMNPKVPKNKELINPIAGILECECGKKMIYREYKRQNQQMACPRLLCPGQVNCHNKSALYSEVISIVCKILQENIDNFEVAIKNQDMGLENNNKQMIDSLEKKLTDLERKEAVQWEKYSEEAMPKKIFESLNRKVLLEQEATKKALFKLRSERKTTVDYRERIEKFHAALDALQSSSFSATEKNELLKQCIEKIIYHREKSKFVDFNGKPEWTDTPIHLDVILRV